MFRFGFDYYPEHWPRERWARDAALMQAAGVNTVRLAEFAWGFLEPRPDEYDFEWLDDALAVLSRHGIQTFLGTPTGSPPPWVMAMYPDAYRVKITRRQAVYGGRRDYCPSHEGFQDRCCRIVAAMAAHYADHPAVIGWQTDNEFSRLCFCEHCRANFQGWLQEKHGSLEAVNRAWGTAFWGHVYTDWTQIPLPEDDGGDPSYNYGPNPALDLDFRRFTSAAVARFQQQQIDILRDRCPDHFVTHNTGFGFEDLNFYDLTRPLDFVSLDYYARNPDEFVAEPGPYGAAMFLDLARGLKDQNFWMTEQQAGQGGMKTLGMMPRPGELRLWSYQSIAHGADAILYFRWRTALFGAEQYWHGALDHHGEPGERYRDLAQVGEELGRIGRAFKGAEYRAQVALICSWDCVYAFQNQPNHPKFDYLGHLAGVHRALNQLNINVDIVPPEADLGRYQLVIAPALYIIGEDLAERLEQYVADGGTLLLTARSGVKDLNNNVVEAMLPGLLADLVGAEVACYEPLPDELDIQIALELSADVQEPDHHLASLWVDVLTPKEAKVINTYADRLFERDGFKLSLTESERELRL